MKEYDRWEEEQGISPSSPEAYYAEDAWMKALDYTMWIMWWMAANYGASPETRMRILDDYRREV